MTNSISEALKPCPFCGGEAKRHTIGDEEPDNAGGDVICCTSCQASSHVEFGRKENLVDRWNTRVAMSRASQPVDAGVGERKRVAEQLRAFWSEGDGTSLHLRAADLLEAKPITPPLDSEAVDNAVASHVLNAARHYDGYDGDEVSVEWDRFKGEIARALLSLAKPVGGGALEDALVAAFKQGWTECADCCAEEGMGRLHRDVGQEASGMYRFVAREQAAALTAMNPEEIDRG